MIAYWYNLRGLSLADLVNQSAVAKQEAVSAGKLQTDSEAPVAVNIFTAAPPTETISHVDMRPIIVTSVASVLSSAAWPLGMIVIVILFQKQIGALIGRIRTVKGPGGIEISTEDLIEELPPTPNQNDPEIEETAKLAPIDAVVTSWVSVERAIKDLYARVQLVTTGDREPTVRRKLDFLRACLESHA